MITDAQKRAQAKYDRDHTRLLTMKINTATDADVLEWWDACQNKQGSVKRLIRQEIDGYADLREYLKQALSEMAEKAVDEGACYPEEVIDEVSGRLDAWFELFKEKRQE